MDEANRLGAMQRAIMFGETSVRPMATRAQMMPPPAAKGPSATQIIAALKKALAQERQARLAAEERLRRVLETASRKAATAPAARLTVVKPLMPTASLPAATGEVIEGEVVSNLSALRAIGGDDVESNDGE